METLVTPRLILRTFKLSDAADEFEFASLHDVGFNAGFKPHDTLEDSEKIIAHFIAQDEVWAIEHKVSRKVIGSIGLHTDSLRKDVNTKELGFVLSPAYQKQGLMVEAVMAVLEYGFNKLNLSLIGANHFSFNESSKNVIQKAGFVYDGIIKRQRRLFDGTKIDLLVYSLHKQHYIKRGII